MDKKIKISAVFISVALFVGALYPQIENSGLVHKMYASGNDAYGHYEAIPAGFGKRGMKEYWISCTSHEPLFTKPDVDASRIIERGQPSLELLNSLDPSDPRIAPSLLRYIDFENEDKTYPFYDLSKSTNIKSATIKDSVGYNGSKCLVIEANNAASDRGLFFTKEFMTEVFSDPSILALEFDVKGDSASANFRHRTAGSNICYQVNSNGWGLSTQWQTFSFTRAMHEADGGNGSFVIWGTMAGYLYLDNIRPVTKDQQADNYSGTKKYQTMDNLGQTTGVGTSQDVIIKNAYNNESELKIWTSSATGITALDYSTTVKTEGSRSLHFHKAAGVTLNFGVSTRIINSLDDAGITFDIMTSIAIGPANFQKFAAGRSSANTNGDYTLVANKWTTVTIAKTNIRDCSPAYVFSFTGTDGQKEMDVYIDNIRPATPVDNLKVFDFDDVGMFTYDTTYREFSSNFMNNGAVNPINASNLRDTGKATFWLNNPNGAGSVSLDHEIASEGYGSLRFDIVDGSQSFFLFFNKSINTNRINVGDSICFDVYNDCVGDITLGQAGTAGRSTGVVCKKGEWTTVKLEKKADKADQFFRLHEAGAGSTGTFYIDNLRIEKGTGPIEYTEKVKVGYDFETGTANVVTANSLGEYKLNDSRVFYASGNSFSNIALVDAPSGKGGTALKLTKNDNYIAIYLNPAFYNAIPSSGSFSFDLYSTIMANSQPNGAKNFLNNSNNTICPFDYQHPAYKWVRYTFNKSDIGSDGRFLIIQGSTGGDWYFDNIVIDANDVYADKGTFYPTTGGYIEFDVGTAIPTGTAVFLDDQPIAYNTTGTSLSFNSALVSNGEHIITFATKVNDYAKNNYTFAFGKYSGTTVKSLVYSLEYGSQGYQTLTNLPSDVKRIMCNDKSIAFERSSGGILIPDAALIECLKTNGSAKQNGTIVMQVISGDSNAVVTELRVAITLTGDSTVLAGYSKRSSDTFETFGYSSTGAGTSKDLNFEENLLEYQRHGLDNVYEQLSGLPVDIPTGYFSDVHTNQNRNYQDIVRCEELGLGFVLTDDYTNKLCALTGSVYGKSIKLSDSTTVSFANEQELYNALYSRYQELASFGCLKKVVLCDEPRWQNIQATGEVYKQARRAMTALGRSDVVINVNLLPISAGWGDDGIGPKPSSILQDIQTKKKNQYSAYLDKWIQYSAADYICFDIYPLNTYLYNSTSDYKDNRTGIDIWFNLNMVVAADYCRDNGLRLNCVTQSCLLTGRQEGTNTRILSMDDIRWLNNMLMGYGVDEISYFTYYARHHDDEYGEQNYGSPMYENETTGEASKTNVWYDYQTMLGEMNDFASVIKNFTYQGSRYYKAGSYTNQGNGYQFAADFDDSNFNNFGNVSAFTIDNGYSLFTALKDDDGQYMQMVQNICDPMYDQRIQTATITFNSSCTYVEIYENGSYRIVKLDANHKLQIKLSSGNAAYLIAF